MPKIATIGFFDGVHRGHRFLFAQLQEYAKHLHLSTAIYTFKQHPKQVLTNLTPAMLTTFEERKTLLEEYGEVCFLDFKEVQKLTAAEFMRYLYEEQSVDTLLIGYDHRFGSDCLKGFSEYEHLGREIGMHVVRAYECLVDGVPVSSSRIRKLLAAGKISDVNRLLGYGYTLSGIVEHGNAIGTRLGFPTANIALGGNKQLPANGVYSVLANVDGVTYHAIANIGTKPTIGCENLSLEVYMLDFVGDLYGKALQVTFLDFLREEKKFASLDELKNQIAIDVQEVRECLRTNHEDI